MIRELSPSIIYKIWGGNKLEKMKNLSKGSEDDRVPIGETIEIFEKNLSYLAKFIDTNDELSIQVHPNDDYAHIHENSSGKTECWVILEANSDAGVYLGLKTHVTKDILKNALEEKKAINDLLNFYPVKRGDFFYVTSGSIHAIGRGITLAEVQQNSGITYRVWDWNRLDELGTNRELHIEKSLDVINFNPQFNTPEFFRIKNNLLSLDGLVELCNHPDFHLFLLNQNKGDVYKQGLLNHARPSAILNLNGKIKINQKEVKSFCAVMIEKESEILISACENGSLLIIF